MYICESCAKKYRVDFVRNSFGDCEVCHNTDQCTKTKLQELEGISVEQLEKIGLGSFKK